MLQTYLTSSTSLYVWSSYTYIKYNYYSKSMGMLNFISYFTPTGKWVWSTDYSIFIQEHWNAGALFLKCFTSLKITLHFACQQSLSKMDVNQAIIAILSFERSMSRLSWSLLFTRPFSHSQSTWCDITVISKYWNQNGRGSISDRFSAWWKVAWVQD